MTATALALVLVAAAVHAGWNYFLKTARGGPGFMTLVAIVAAIVWAPVAAGQWLWQGYVFQWVHLAARSSRARRSIPPTSSCSTAATGTATFRWSTRSRARPGRCSRSPPRCSCSASGRARSRSLGAALVILGAYLLTGNPLRLFSRDRPKGAGFALLTGCTIALYTVVDKLAVSHYLIPPIVFDWACVDRCGSSCSGRSRCAANPNALRDSWRVDRRAIILVALLSPLAYILVLTAMVFTPVSYVAPAREVSILFAALLGAHFLKERDPARRLVAAAAIVLGIVGLALG